MARNRILLVLLLSFTFFAIAPVVHAQQTQFPSFSEIVQNLKPRSGQGLLWDLMLYAIFFLGLVTTILIPDKQFIVTVVMAVVLVMAVVAKLQVFKPGDFGTLVLNIGMFVLPLISAGMVRQRSGTARAVAPAALTGLLGGAYFFLFWALEQRNLPQ